MPSSLSELLSRSPFELDEESPGRPPVGIELPEDDTVEPGLELLELEELDELELEADGIDGEPELEELDTDGMEGELELDEDDDGIDGIEDEELELEDEGIEGDDELLELEELEEDAVGIDGDELELLLWVSVLHAVNIRLNADTVKNTLTGKRAAGLSMLLSRVLLMILPLSCVRLNVLRSLLHDAPDIDRVSYPRISSTRISGTQTNIANS